MSLKFVQTQAIALYTGLSAAGTSAVVTPYPRDIQTNTKLVFADFGTTPTFTVDPKIPGYEEIISFTGITDNGDNTATLTGLTRNLIGQSPYTTPGTGKLHGSSAVIVFSDNPQMWARLGALENDNTWTGKQTFTGGTVQRVNGTTSSATPTPNIDTTTIYKLTALATNAVFAAPSGTPTDGQVLVIRIKSDGTIRTLGWNAIYVARGVPMPTATVASKYTYIAFIYNSTETTWDCVASDQET